MADTTNTLTANQDFAELDFAQLKQSLINYLQSRPEFVDYNFSGSIANLLLDVLTYNTQYNAFYQNMLFAEHFLDTAQKRESIVSRAKELGYTARSAAASQAVLNIQLVSDNPLLTNLVMPSGTTFTTSLAGVSYKFVTLQDYSSTSVDTTLVSGKAVFSFTGVSIFEGTPLTQTTIIDSTTQNGIPLPNTNVDTSLLTVLVADSANVSLQIPYTLGTNLVSITPSSNVYFVDEINDELHLIYFGDGTIGKQIQIGNQVSIKYLVCSGQGANNASLFTLASTITTVSSVYSYTTISTSFGGADIEDQSAVAFNAPLIYAAQDRAIVPADYIAILSEQYSNFASVAAWGGEDNVPQALGYVFISILPNDANFLTDSEKAQIEQNLKTNYCPVTILPIVVDPELLYLIINVTVKYNSTVATSGPDTIEGEVVDTIYNYGQSDLNQFEQYFRYSKLSREIDGSDIAINNNNISVLMETRFVPDLTQPKNYNFFYRNAVKELAGVLTSNTFTFNDGIQNYNNCYLSNDINGVISVYTIQTNGLAVVVVPNAGSLDFGTGTVTLNDFYVTSLGPTPPIAGQPPTIDVRIQLQPVQQDIIPVRNMILEIDRAEINVNMVPDTVS